MMTLGLAMSQVSRAARELKLAIMGVTDHSIAWWLALPAYRRANDLVMAVDDVTSEV